MPWPYDDEPYYPAFDDPAMGMPRPAALTPPPMIDEPDYASEIAMGQQQLPDDFFSRLAMSGVQFGRPGRITSGTRGGGLAALLGLGSLFLGAKVGGAARNIANVEASNQRAREAESTLVTRRHEMNKARLAAAEKQADRAALAAHRKATLDARGEPSEPLVPVQGPNGVIYARRSEAVGMSPPAQRPGRLVQIIGDDGLPTWSYASDAVGQRSVTAKPVTGAERQSLAFYLRAKDAIETMEAAGESGSSLEQRVANAPLAQQVRAAHAPNVAKTPEQRAYTQAQRAFTEARLRKESGAAIPPAEYENDRITYFQQPGDDPATIEQKRKARRVVLDGLRFASGRAYDEFYGTPQPEPVGAQPSRRRTPGRPQQSEGISDEQALREYQRVIGRP